MIYLDHHAATPISEAALGAMREARAESWANPSSAHRAGRASRAHLERARRRVASVISAAPADIILTAGGTEACNLGIRGLRVGTALALSTSLEHPASGNALDASDAPLRRFECPGGCPPSARELAAWLDEAEAPSLVSIQWVNHETGVVFPVAAYGRVCAERGAHLFVDATQALGKVEIDVDALPGLSAMAFASHKIGGPAGAGALWLRRGVDISPTTHGGSQERGRRAGTPDVLAQVGFGAACADVPTRLSQMKRIASLRSRLEVVMVELGFVINGVDHERVATAVDGSLRGWRGEVLSAALDLEGVCASSGAACSSGLAGGSAVVAAMYPEESWRAASSLRFSLGPETRSEEVETAAAILRRVVKRGAR